MKLTHKTLAIVALMAPLPAANAQTMVDIGTIQARIATSLSSLEQLTEIGTVLPSDIDNVGSDVGDLIDVLSPSLPESKPIRQGLEAYLEDLRRRAGNAFISKQHVAFLREQVVETQLEVALQELIRRSRAAEWTPRQFRRVRAQLIARAEAAVDDPSSRYLRQRFEELAPEATLRAQSAFAKKVAAFRLEVIEFRLQGALKKVRGMRREGLVSEPAFQKMVLALHLQARAALNG